MRAWKWEKLLKMGFISDCKQTILFSYININQRMTKHQIKELKDSVIFRGITFNLVLITNFSLNLWVVSLQLQKNVELPSEEESCQLNMANCFLWKFFWKKKFSHIISLDYSSMSILSLIFTWEKFIFKVIISVLHIKRELIFSYCLFTSPNFKRSNYAYWWSVH